MTIKEFILKNEIKNAEARYEKMLEIGAPKVVIASIEKQIDSLKNGKLSVGGDAELLDEEMENFEIKKGRGGVEYAQFNGKINFFPRAKYGMYVKKAK